MLDFNFILELMIRNLQLWRYFAIRNFSKKVIQEDRMPNWLINGFNFTQPQIAILAANNPSLLTSIPCDTQFPAVWSTMQRYGLSNIDKFRELCLKEPLITQITLQQIEGLFKIFAEYKLFNGVPEPFDIFLTCPSVLLKKTERIQRILHVVHRLLDDNAEAVGELAKKFPFLMLCSVHNFIF